MLHTPLYKYHTERNAKMVDFAGWEMPLHYGSIIDEHNATRTAAGLFDVSHMGRVSVKGRHARRFLERLCTRRVSDMQQGQCRYALVCNERGGVRDDVLVYREDDDKFTLVVNASNRAKLLEHFDAIKGDLKPDIKDKTESTAMVALQGPNVMPMLADVSSTIPELKRYRFLKKNLVFAELLVSRTGYTGENGVEVIVPKMAVGAALKMLASKTNDAGEAAIAPCGLGARDTLRMEAGMPLYGHELLEDRVASECGVGFAINLDKSDDDGGEPFVGQDAFKTHESKGAIVGLLPEGKRSPRQGMAVLAGDTHVGEVTSGCASPTLGRPIAIAYVGTEHASPGSAVRIDMGKQTVEAEVCALPFYKAPKK